MGAPELEGVVIREGLVIRPGDTLLLRLERPLSMDEHDQLGTHLKECVPGLVNVAFIYGAVDWAVYRPTVSVELRCGGSALADQFGGAVRQMVRTDYPDAAGGP